jgi:hypothetical protein
MRWSNCLTSAWKTNFSDAFSFVAMFNYLLKKYWDELTMGVES